MNAQIMEISPLERIKAKNAKNVLYTENPEHFPFMTTRCVND